MTGEFTQDDEGKTVVTAEGTRVGTVHKAGGIRVHVTPDTELGERVRDRLGWTAAENQVYELTTEAVEAVTDGEVRLVASLTAQP